MLSSTSSKSKFLLALAVSCVGNVWSQKVFGPQRAAHQPASRAAINYILFESFESQSGALPEGWSTGGLSSGFYVGSAGSGTLQANEAGFWPVPLKGSFAMTNDDACDCDKSADFLSTPSLNLAGRSSVTMGFEAYQDGANGQQASVQAFDTAWHTLQQIPAAGIWQSIELNIPAQFLKPDTKFRFFYSDDSTYASGLAIDNVYFIEHTEEQLDILGYYALGSGDERFEDFYSRIPHSEAQSLRIAPSVALVKRGSALANARLIYALSGEHSSSDTIGVSTLLPNAESAVSIPTHRASSPFLEGEYKLRSEAATDSGFAITHPADSISFLVADSVYSRNPLMPDGTGIWMTNPTSRVGNAFHLTSGNEVTAVRVFFHQATQTGSRFRIKVFHYDTLSASTYSTAPITVASTWVGSVVDIPLQKAFGPGKYLFALEKESGDLAIASSLKKTAIGNSTLVSKSGSNWQRFPFVPFIQLILPYDEDCKSSITGRVTPETCAGDEDAVIELDTSGLTNPTFNWSPPAGNVAKLENLASGNYFLTVTDENGCQYFRRYQVRTTAPISTGLVVSHDICGQGEGAMSVSPTGGVEPLSVLWSTGSLLNEINGLDSGVYSVTVEDAMGCSIVDSLNIISGSQLILSAVPTLPNCNTANGNLSTTILSSNGSVSYAWSNGDTTSTADSLAAGIYYVQVTDSLGCSVTQEFILPDSGGSTVMVANKTDIDCYGTENGTMEVSAVGSGGYTYHWTDSVSTSNAAQNLAPGKYYVTVADSNGCSSFTSGVIEQTVLPISAYADAKGIICAPNTDGNVQSYVSGGTEPYNWQWDNGKSTEAIAQLDSGSYSVTITDDLGCTAIASASVGEVTPLSISIDSTRNDDSTIIDVGAIYTTISGGTLPYRVLWNSQPSDPDLIGIKHGTYMLEVSDQFGCMARDTVVLPDFPLTSETSVSMNLPVVYPNPARDRITISWDKPINSLLMYDTRGTIVPIEVTTTTDRVRQVDLTAISSGLYLIKINHSRAVQVLVLQ